MKKKGFFLKEVFPGVFSEGRRLFTKNLVAGKRVYGEQLITFGNIEYRQWQPMRSKLAAAIIKGLKELPLKKGSNVLYLGSSEGTTASHISDITGETGIIFGVDISETAMRRFVELCEERENIVPVLADAAKPPEYKEYLRETEIDLLYQDIAQKNQAEIFNKNAEMFLKKKRHGLIAIKAKSISQMRKAKEIFQAETSKLKEQFEILQTIPLEPFEKDHVMVSCRKK